MPLLDYISKRYGGNQAAFARDQGVPRQQITKWINAEFIVVDGWLYSPRREINAKSLCL
jgi:hypothetical protein